VRKLPALTSPQGTTAPTQPRERRSWAIVILSYDARLELSGKPEPFKGRCRATRGLPGSEADMSAVSGARAEVGIPGKGPGDCRSRTGMRGSPGLNHRAGTRMSIEKALRRLRRVCNCPAVPKRKPERVVDVVGHRKLSGPESRRERSNRPAAGHLEPIRA